MRRQTGWDLGPDSSAGVVTATSITKRALGTGITVVTDGNTIVRIRGRLSYWIEVANVNAAGFESHAVGLCVITEDAFDIGPTAIPGPVTDDEWDGWMWHSWLETAIAPATANIDFSGGGAVHHEVIDTKAMRKFTDNSALVLMWEGLTQVGSPTMKFAFGTRTLLKLP